MTPEQKQELKKGFKEPMMAFSMSDANGKYQNINLAELVDDVIYKDRADAMNVLLEAGIANRNWSAEAHPLHNAIMEGKENMVEKMLVNLNTRKFLEQEASLEGISSLHIAASIGNKKIIEEILKYPESANLLTKKDQHGLTPLASAKKFKNTKALNILTETEQRLKFQKLLNSKEFKESAKNFSENADLRSATNSPVGNNKNKKQSMLIK